VNRSTIASNAIRVTIRASGAPRQKVDAFAKRQVIVRAARDVESLWLRKLCGVAIRSAE
jgi:hypothetical protein